MSQARTATFVATDDLAQVRRALGPYCADGGKWAEGGSSGSDLATPVPHDRSMPPSTLSSGRIAAFAPGLRCDAVQ
jgi:hypothetical protein